ncbi:MAG: hypothetical protein ARM1_0655 [Candidatus Micrarchaeota archaeon]|nr:MAG: hypothetical protein ARM1_0655 [Candidatus Micrarchaeota archaeon]
MDRRKQNSGNSTKINALKAALTQTLELFRESLKGSGLKVSLSEGREANNLGVIIDNNEYVIADSQKTLISNAKSIDRLLTMQAIFALTISGIDEKKYFSFLDTYNEVIAGCLSIYTAVKFIDPILKAKYGAEYSNKLMDKANNLMNNINNTPSSLDNISIRSYIDNISRARKDLILYIKEIKDMDEGIAYWFEIIGVLNKEDRKDNSIKLDKDKSADSKVADSNDSFVLGSKDTKPKQNIKLIKSFTAYLLFKSIFSSNNTTIRDYDEDLSYIMAYLLFTTKMRINSVKDLDLASLIESNVDDINLILVYETFKEEGQEDVNRDKIVEEAIRYLPKILDILYGKDITKIDALLDLDEESFKRINEEIDKSYQI